MNNFIATSFDIYRFLFCNFISWNFIFENLPVSLCKLKFSGKEVAYLLNCEILSNFNCNWLSYASAGDSPFTE